MLIFKIIVCAIFIVLLLIVIILLLGICVSLVNDVLSEIFGYQLSDIIRKRLKEKHDCDFI